MCQVRDFCAPPVMIAYTPAFGNAAGSFRILGIIDKAKKELNHSQGVLFFFYPFMPADLCTVSFFSSYLIMEITVTMPSIP